MSDAQNLHDMNAEADTDGWHVVTEDRESEWFKLPDGTPEIYKTTFIKRDDGLTVKQISGPGRGEDRHVTFLFKGSFGQFEITASRWWEWGWSSGTPLDIYTVMFYHPYVQENAIPLIHSMANVVVSALKHYPLDVFSGGIPIKDVVFQIAMARSPSTIKHAHEL